MDEREAKEIMDQVVFALRKAGYNPKAQIQGYLAYDDENCITKRDNARGYIQLVEKEYVEKYVDKYL